MTTLQYLQQNSGVYLATVFFMGLIFGSFFNVVIYRLPIMLKRQWLKMSKDYLQEEGFQISGNAKDKILNEDRRFTLSHPVSSCPKCSHKIRAWENIPLLSYLFLKGKCASCKTSISIRYPLVELLTAIIFLVVAYHYPPGWQVLTLLVFSSFLIILSGIDIDHQLLPDPLVYILLWSGLAAAVAGLTISPVDALIGALAGYLSLWTIFWLFKVITGKEGMGYGDFKLLAALGAWLGWKFLLPLIIIASILGAVVGGLSMLVFKAGNKIPFGPYLAASGWIMLLWGQQIINAYLKWAHLA